MLLISTASLHSQYKHDYIWTLGTPNPQNDPNNFVLDFNNGQVKIYKYLLNLNFRHVNPNFSDESGNLFAYSNGCVIYNRLGYLMENGDNLNPGFIQQGTWCEQGYPGGNQSHFFLQDPGNSKILWLFHLSYSESINYPYATFLRVSKIDISLNNDLGKVIEKNTKIVIDSFLTFGEVSACKHFNNEDWWILSPTARSDTLYRTFLLTKAGLIGPFEQRIGKQLDQVYSGGGAFKFNPQGTKLARYGDGGQGVFLYDFDRQSGLLSNFMQLDTPKYVSLGGAEFSPSGRYLYVSTRRELFQYDMDAPDIGKSVIRIDSLDGFKTWTTVTFGNMQLGPDCRIYVVPTTGVEYFGVIHKPENRGMACDFRPHSLKLPYYNQLTRIYYPNYRMEVAPVCDSTISFTTGSFDFKPYLNTISIYPNPTSDELNISLLGSLYQTSKLDLINSFGYTVASKDLKPGDINFKMDVHAFAPGVYILKLQDKSGMIGLEKVIIE